MIKAVIAAVSLVAGSIVAAAPAQAATTVSFGSLVTADAYQGTLRATGRLSPAPRQGSPVYLQRYDVAHKRWLDIGLGRSDGSAVTVMAKAQGSYLWYRLRYGSAVSSTKHFQHFVWRGAFNKPSSAGGGTRRFAGPVSTGDRSVMFATGAAWADVDTTGCKSLEADFAAQDTTLSASIRRGSSVLTSSALTVGATTFRTASFAPVSRLRLTVSATSRVGLFLLCSNNAPGLRGPLTPADSATINLEHQDPNHVAGRYGSQAGMVGYLADTRGGTSEVSVGLGGKTVRVLRSAPGARRWSTFMTVRVRASGMVPIWVTRGYPYDYAIAIPDPGTAPGGPELLFGTMGTPLHPVVQRWPILDRLSVSGRTVRASGRVFPTPPNGSGVYLQRYVAGSGWRNIALGRTTGGSSFTLSVTVGPSTSSYRLYAPAKSPYAAGASTTRSLRVP